MAPGIRGKHALVCAACKEMEYGSAEAWADAAQPADNGLGARREVGRLQNFAQRFGAPAEFGAYPGTF